MDSRKNKTDTTFENYIQSVHDHFFRESMQYIEIGYGITKAILPLSIQYRIDWDTLEIAKGDWIDRRLKEHRSDVLYRARILDNNQWVNFLFEHKSKPDKKTHKQLLRYIVESWDLHEQQEPSCELLPDVLSIIVYHGTTPWKIANSIKPLIAIIEETQDCVPDFRAYLFDLSAFDLGQIADSRLKMFLLALKYGKTVDILGILPQIIKISEKIDGSGNGDAYLGVLLIYLGSVIKSSDKDKFLQIITKEHRDGGVYMETIADALRKEERLRREKEVAALRKKLEQQKNEIEQQIEQKDTALHEIVQKMLRRDMNFQMIGEITGLSYEEIKQIKDGAAG